MSSIATPKTLGRAGWMSVFTLLVWLTFVSYLAIGGVIGFRQTMYLSVPVLVVTTFIMVLSSLIQ